MRNVMIVLNEVSEAEGREPEVWSVGDVRGLD
jgi:hypothetical protein